MIDVKSPRQRRKASKPAEIMQPDPGFQLSKRVRRLQRKAPLYALQGISELSVRLRQMTGHDVIDFNRVMEFVQFLYKQQALARRGANYAVDDFGFDLVEVLDILRRYFYSQLSETKIMLEEIGQEAPLNQ